jgi:hypothetical protein
LHNAATAMSPHLGLADPQMTRVGGTKCLL